MPVAKCSKCGRKFYGWALKYKPETRVCPDCKIPIKVEEEKRVL
jgi:DNA-directed RNA polymerase subunit RPC12/RpoP